MSKKAFLQKKLQILNKSDEYWYGRNCLPYYKPILEHNIRCALKDIIVALGCKQRLSESRFVQDVIYLTYLKACLPNYEVLYSDDFRTYISDAVDLLSSQVGKGKCLDSYIGYDFKPIEGFIGAEVNLLTFSQAYRGRPTLKLLDYKVSVLTTKNEYLGLFYMY